MSPNENSKSEQLSQSIDAEIERKLSERLRELQERLDERVQEKIQGDREFIKDTIGVAFKVAGLAVALVVVLLGILGWKTFADVHKAMTDAATERAQRYFDNQEGRNIIDSAIDRSVLNSYLIQMALVDADKSLRQQFRGIENPDVNRLLRIVNSAEMKDTTNFDSATNLLMKGARQEMISEVGGAFADLIAAKGKDLKWIESNSWKRRRLLDKLNETRFSDDQVKTACRELLSTAAEKVDLRRAAITYLGTIRDPEALEKLLDLAETGKELVPDALIALAKIEPKSDVLTKWMANLDKISDPPSETIATALKINEARKDKQDRDSVLKLLGFAARHCRLFPKTRSPKTVDYFWLVCPSDRYTPREIREIRIESTILFSQNDDWTDTVTELLRRYAQETDLKDFRSFIHWLTMKAYPSAPIPLVSVKLLMPQNSAITLENGEIADRQSAPDGVVVVPDETKDGKPSEQIKIVWTDPEKRNRSGILAKFENAKDLRFKREMSFF